MTDTPPPDPAPVVPPSTEPKWIKPVLAVGSLVMFAVITAVAVITKNEPVIMMLASTSVGSLMVALNYYFGSSSGSTRKTELAAAPK